MQIPRYTGSGTGQGTGQGTGLLVVNLPSLHSELKQSYILVALVTSKCDKVFPAAVM